MKISKILFPFLAIFMASSCVKLPEFGDNNNDDDSKYASFTFTEEQAKQNADTFLGNEYQVTFTLGTDESNSTYVFGQKENVQWCLFGDEEDGNDGMAIVVEGMTTHLYDYTSEGFEYTASVSTEGEENEFKDLYASILKNYFYIGYGYEGTVSKAGKATVAGRTGTKYAFVASAYGVTTSYTVVLDDEIGITLLYSYSLRGAEENISLNFEVKEILTGSAVTAPTLPEPVLED